MDEQLELPSQDVPALPVDLDKSDEQLGLELQDVPSPVDLDELDEQLGLQPELEAPGLPINLRLPPPLKDSEETLEDIKHLLKPPRASGVGHYWAKFPPTSKERLEEMKTLLWFFCDATRKVEEQGGCSSHRLRLWERASQLPCKIVQVSKSFGLTLHFHRRSLISPPCGSPLSSQATLALPSSSQGNFRIPVL